MKNLKITTEDRVNTEVEANEYIQKIKNEAKTSGFKITKAEYSYKTKKKKGEVISDGYLVKITRTYDDFWGPEDEMEAE